MRFALRDHPDGLDLARALADTGRHELTVYSGPQIGLEYLRRWGMTAAPVGDLEEVLADPLIDAVLVAGSPTNRPAQLRRALQSQRHVLCVHPADQTIEVAYEAAMLQGDTGVLLLPLLPETLHPAVMRLAELVHDEAKGQPDLPPFRLIEMERWSPEFVLLDGDTPGHRPSLPGWDVLRLLGGEIAEVSSLSAPEEMTADEPLLLMGRFERGGLLQASFLPNQSELRWRLAVVTASGRLELTFPSGWPGPARLTWPDQAGELREETWEAWNPWPALVEEFETALGLPLPPAAGGTDGQRLFAGAAGEDLREAVTAATVGQSTSGPVLVGARPRLTWQDEVRCLELDDAARRSVERRRASTLEYQEATEEAGFKGTMTLVGCGVLWLSLALLILSRWLPWLGWVIVPAFGLFLALQLLRLDRTTGKR